MAIVDDKPYGRHYEEMPEHKHWATFDMILEGCRFNLLHELVGAAAFDAARAGSVLEDIEALAQSKGYGDEDSFIWEAGGPLHGDPAYAAAREDQHNDDPDADYTGSVDASVGLLSAAAASPEAQSFVSRIGSTVADARVRGRRMRDEQQDAVRPAP